MSRTESKYRNKKVVTGGISHDSRKEKKRHDALIVLERCGQITNLRRQVPFLLIPAQYEGGKCVERSVTYIADFVYCKDGEEVVEDVKGFETDVWKIKRKLMLFIHKKRIITT